MAVFVGLDCGGSSTRVLAVDDSGKPIFRGQAGPANVLSTPPDILRRSLTTAAKGCPTATSVCGCFAGLVDTATRERATKLLKGLFPKAQSFRAEPDYAAALAACGKNAHACVIAGTGSIVCSWVDGKAVKTGGRGPILGDPGSASEIGRHALSAYLDHPSKFSAAFNASISDVLGAAEERAIITALYAQSSPAKALAEIGKAVAGEAAVGNVLAEEILAWQMAKLAAMAARHLQAFGPPDGGVRVGLSGGLWKAGRSVSQEFEVQLTRLMPEIHIDLFVLRKAPVEGAVALAKETCVVN